MKAEGSPSCEISVKLTNQEISELEKNTLKGTIRLRNKGEILDKDIEIYLGELGENYCVELNVSPEGVGYPYIQLYSIIISDLGYGMLKRKRMTMDRVGFGGKVVIFNQKYNRH